MLLALAMATGSANATPSSPKELQVAKRAPIAYPRLAMCEGQEGKARILIGIDAAGTPTDLKVLRSSGSAELDQAAMDSLRHWTFTSVGKNSSGYIDVAFTLDLEPGEKPAQPSRCRDVHFSLFGGLVNEMPGYEPFSLEVHIFSLPADTESVTVLVLNAQGKIARSTDISMTGRDNTTPATKLMGLAPGAYQLVIEAKGTERGRGSFIVQPNGSVETRQQSPEAED